MKIEPRRRMHDSHTEFHHDLALVAENAAESSMLDLLAAEVGDDGSAVVGEDGLIARCTAEVRLSDGYADHYVLLQPRTVPRGTRGTRVTCEDIETGDSEVQEVQDNYIVVTDGRSYVDGYQYYPGTGTTVLTIKLRPVSDG